MKMTYIIIGLLLVSGIIIYLTLNRQHDNQTDSKRLKDENSEENPYTGLRTMALTVTPEQLGLSLTQNDILVYGIIMDWEMDGAVSTTACYQTGDASMYLSTGGGVIGGGQHENVNKASKELIKLAQNYLVKTTLTISTPLPDKNTVKFYFLTNKGTYTIDEEIGNFENNSSKLYGLFEEFNKVITELRLTTEG